MTDYKKEFCQLCKLRYKDQAIWFLNGFWGAGVDANVANTVWKYVEKFIELDKMGTNPQGADGHDLDQFWSAKFLEDLDQTLTSIDRKNALRQIDQDSNGMMSCIEYLTWKFKKTVEQVAKAPQGDNTAAIEAAQRKLDEVQENLAACDEKLKAQVAALDANKKQKAELARAQQELEAAVAETKRQEEAIAQKTRELEEKSAKGGVSGMKAKNELAQLKGEDPLPLRKAKITQEAAVRRVKKEQEQCELREQELKQAIEDLERAYATLEATMEEARKELDEIRSMPGGGKGAIWWMERELFEADARLPNAKQRYNHKQPFFFDP